MKGLIDYIVLTNYPVPRGTTIGAKALARWMGDDIQYSVREVERWLMIFQEVAAGRWQSGYQGTGNTHSVMASHEWVLIESEYQEEQKVFLTRQQVALALEQYKVFLQNDYHHSHRVPEPFEVEYEAEGQEARERYLAIGGSLA